MPGLLKLGGAAAMVFFGKCEFFDVGQRAGWGTTAGSGEPRLEFESGSLPPTLPFPRFFKPPLKTSGKSAQGGELYITLNG